jgi:chromosome partitioning protein
MPIYAITNDQAQSGKTTTAVNLAGFWGGFGASTLLIDCDPSGDATSAMGRRAVTFGLFRVMTDETLDGTIAPGAVRGVDVIMGGPKLHTLETHLHHQEAVRPELRLRQALESVRDRYTYIILDCPTEAGLLRSAALLAANAVIVPVACRTGAQDEAQASLGMIQETRRGESPAPRAALLRTLLDTRDPDSAGASQSMRAAYPRLTLGTRIPLDPTLARAQEQGMPILLYAPDSHGSRAYQALALEIAERIARSA